tara:strand:- start:97 stop:270 length:174 start_codon:yes stop_codon:yes gene_type:complete
LTPKTCPYCLGQRHVTLIKTLFSFGKIRVVREIKEPCAYCNLIRIDKEIDLEDRWKN